MKEFFTGNLNGETIEIVSYCHETKKWIWEIDLKKDDVVQINSDLHGAIMSGQPIREYIKNHNNRAVNISSEHLKKGKYGGLI